MVQWDQKNLGLKSANKERRRIYLADSPAPHKVASTFWKGERWCIITVVVIVINTIVICLYLVHCFSVIIAGQLTCCSDAFSLCFVGVLLTVWLFGCECGIVVVECCAVVLCGIVLTDWWTSSENLERRGRWAPVTSSGRKFSITMSRLLSASLFLCLCLCVSLLYLCICFSCSVCFCLYSCCYCCSLRQMMLSTSYLAPRHTAGCCHLVPNLAAWSHSRCLSVLEVTCW